MGSQFGSQINQKIIDRGNVNAQGVEVVSIALGIEPSGYDSSIQSFASRNHFQFSGVDALTDDLTGRGSPRDGFSYYSGFAASLTPSMIGSAERRRFLILNGVQNSVSHKPWELLYNSNSFRTSDAASVLALIDSILPGNGDPMEGEGESFVAWASKEGLTEANVEDDPDGDGMSNLLEYVFGTSPTGANDLPFRLETKDSGFIYTYPKAHKRFDYTLFHERSEDLVRWEAIQPGEGELTSGEGETGDVVSWKISPSEVQTFFRIRAVLAE